MKYYVSKNTSDKKSARCYVLIWSIALMILIHYPKEISVTSLPHNYVSSLFTNNFVSLPFLRWKPFLGLKTFLAPFLLLSNTISENLLQIYENLQKLWRKVIFCNLTVLPTVSDIFEYVPTYNIWYIPTSFESRDLENIFVVYVFSLVWSFTTSKVIMKENNTLTF